MRDSETCVSLNNISYTSFHVSIPERPHFSKKCLVKERKKEKYMEVPKLIQSLPVSLIGSGLPCDPTQSEFHLQLQAGVVRPTQITWLRMGEGQLPQRKSRCFCQEKDKQCWRRKQQLSPTSSYPLLYCFYWVVLSSVYGYAFSIWLMLTLCICAANAFSPHVISCSVFLLCES